MEVKVGGLIPNLIKFFKNKRKNKNDSNVDTIPTEKQDDLPFEGYRLTVSYCNSGSVNYIADPTLDAISDALDKMSLEKIEFAILENSKCIGGCAFIQTAWGGNGVYIVEAQVRRRKGERVLRSQYKITTEDKSQVENLFGAYLQGNAPDVSDWEYMDDFDFYEE